MWRVIEVIRGFFIVWAVFKGQLCLDRKRK